MNLSKVREEDNSYYVLNTGSISKWEKRLEIYMEDALVLMRPVQNQVLLKTLPGLAQSFGSIIDALNFPDAIATLCGDDSCLVICENAEAAQHCFEELKKFTPPFSLVSKQELNSKSAKVSTFLNSIVLMSDNIRQIQCLILLKSKLCSLIKQKKRNLTHT